MASIPTTKLEREAWRVLDGEGEILEVARDVSRILRESGVRGAIVGGVAVGLHGHLRATMDVDVYVPAPLERFADALRQSGYEFDSTEREFRRGAVPVQFVTDDQTGGPPQRISVIREITTVGLPDLINMKLRSGTSSVLRAQDIADVIGLIRKCELTAAFAPKVEKAFRAEFKRLAKAVQVGK